MLLQRNQVADAHLHLVQQRRVGRFFFLVEVINLGERKLPLAVLGVIHRVEQAHKVTALAAPCGQERMRMGMHVLQRQVRQLLAFAQRLASALGAQQLAPVHDVAPVVAAGVGQGQDHLAVRRQRCQGLQRGRRHLAHAKGCDPLGHGLRHRLATGQVLQKLLMQARAYALLLCCAQGSEHRAPQRSLPALVVGQRLRCAIGQKHMVVPGSPGVQPVAAVVLVLVVEVRQLVTELQQARGIVVLQKPRHRPKHRLAQQAGEQLHQAPGHGQLVQGRLAGHGLRAQHLAVGAPQKARRQLHTRSRTHATPARQLHLQPLGHAVALHQDDFFHQRRQRRALQPRGHHLHQVFSPVAVKRHEARLQAGWAGEGGSGHGGKDGESRAIVRVEA